MKKSLKSFAATLQLFALSCLLTSPVHADNSWLNNCSRTVDPDVVLPNFLNAAMDCTSGGNPEHPSCFGKGCIVRELVRNSCQECAYDSSLSWLTFPCDEITQVRFLEWAEYSKPCYFARDGYGALDLGGSFTFIHGVFSPVSGNCECNENPDMIRGPFPKSKRCTGAICSQTCSF